MGAVLSGSSQAFGTPSGRTRASRTSRAQVLEEAALEAARTWVNRCVEDLERDGRRIEGGWPGTLNEARGLCAELAASTLAHFSMIALARGELDRAAHVTYVEARRLWSAR